MNKHWYKHLLDKDCVVTTSGSKFYKAPGHCGAVFVPPGIMEQLKNVDKGSIIEEWGSLVPEAMNSFIG